VLCTKNAQVLELWRRWRAQGTVGLFLVAPKSGPILPGSRFIPRDRPSIHTALKTEIDAMTQLALRLVALADPVEAAANED